MHHIINNNISYRSGTNLISLSNYDHFDWLGKKEIGNKWCAFNSRTIEWSVKLIVDSFQYEIHMLFDNTLPLPYPSIKMFDIQ